MKMKPLSMLIVIVAIISVSFTPPKKFTCRTGHIHVESYSRFLDVIADNNQIYSELDPSTGKVTFAGLLKGFTFEMGALDRAFNSGRVDVSAYNKFNFEGSVVNNKKINYDLPGTYPATVQGTLFMGGQKRVTTANGEVRVFVDGKIEANANFVLRIEESSMKTINKLMREKLPSVLSIDADKLGIARDIKLKLKANYRPKN